MKIFTVLFSLLQIAVIVAVLFKLDTLDQNIAELVRAQSNLASNELPPSPLAMTTPAVNQSDTQPSQEQIRIVIREELSAALLTAFPEQPSIQAGRLNSRYQDESEHQNQLENVSDQIDYHMRQGAISDQEMSALQIELTTLDQAGRNLMMRKLVRALNSGDLKGRL